MTVALDLIRHNCRLCHPRMGRLDASKARFHSFERTQVADSGITGKLPFPTDYGIFLLGYLMTERLVLIGAESSV